MWRLGFCLGSFGARSCCGSGAFLRLETKLVQDEVAVEVVPPGTVALSNVVVGGS